jgi:hypothetical protein
MFGWKRKRAAQKEAGGAATPVAGAADQPAVAAPDPLPDDAPGGAGEPIEEAGPGWLEALIDEGAVLGVAGIPEGALSDPAHPGAREDSFDGRPEPESLRPPADLGADRDRPPRKP